MPGNYDCFRTLCLTVMIVGINAAAVFSSESLAWGQNRTTNHASKEEGRIHPKDVNLQNYTIFEDQVRRELPIGTAKADVNSYLDRLNITHSLVKRGALVDENTFYGILENLGIEGSFQVSLAIRIHLDADDKVDRIWFRLDYL